MIDIATSDATFRTDRAGNPVLSTYLDYYLGVVNQLFNMIPGSDPFNPEMGINLSKYLFEPGVKGEHHSQLEKIISDQFTKFTDLMVNNVAVMFLDGGWKITFLISSNAFTFRTMVGYREDTLSILIDPV